MEGALLANVLSNPTRECRKSLSPHTTRPPGSRTAVFVCRLWHAAGIAKAEHRKRQHHQGNPKAQSPLPQRHATLPRTQRRVRPADCENCKNRAGDLMKKLLASASQATEGTSASTGRNLDGVGHKRILVQMSLPDEVAGKGIGRLDKST